jgi:kinesin family member 15
MLFFQALEHEVWEVKLLAAQKSFEASILIDKFEEASKNAKLEAEKCKERETLFMAKNNDMLNKIDSLKMLLDRKEHNYNLMEKKFQASLLETNGLALELEEDVRLLQNLLSEKLDFVSSDVNWMKTTLQQFAELTRTWLEESWLEIIGEKNVSSVLHQCHMGVLLERIMGLNAENDFLQRGLCNSNSLITELREINDKAKNELEMCSVLKGKLLFDISHSFCLIAEKEQETTELYSRLDSFEKKILHLQAQEETMVARSNSMSSELSLLIADIDATNRSALAAESNEKEELRHQLDEAWLLIGLLKDKMLKELNILQMNNPEPSNDIHGCTEFELCNWLADYRTDLMMTNLLAKNIESTVLALELMQHKRQLWKQGDMFADVFEGLKAEATLWAVDQDLKMIEFCLLKEENTATKTELEILKQKNETLRREMELKTEAINLRIARENDLSNENEMLKQKILDISSKEQRMDEMMANIEAERLFATTDERLQLIIDHVQNYFGQQINMVSKFCNELDMIQISAEELSIQNSLLQCDISRKDELAKGLSFDLLLLQESATLAKDQADELTIVREEIKSLQQELASKSLELDAIVSDRQILEDQIWKVNKNVTALEQELAKKIDEHSTISMQNTELKSQLEHIEGISRTMEVELADKIEASTKLEEELIEMRSLIEKTNGNLQSLQNDLSKLLDEKQFYETQVCILQEKLEMAHARAEESEAMATESLQVHRTY